MEIVERVPSIGCLELDGMIEDVIDNVVYYQEYAKSFGYYQIYIDMEYDDSADGQPSKYYLFGYREETPKETRKRLAFEKKEKRDLEKKKLLAEENERKEYERLKKKFG